MGFAPIHKYLETRHAAPMLRSPLLLPAYIYRTYRRKAEFFRATVDELLWGTEVGLGYAIPGTLPNELPKGNIATLHITASNPGYHDFDATIRSLHSCIAELGAVTHAGVSAKEMGLFLKSAGNELTERFGEGLGHESDLQEIEFQTNLFSTLLSQVSILKLRAESHINLTFGIIAQDENRISRSTAEESAMIALASKRDSAAMKTIAVLTIVFLPPTFVATFFSMSMFDWTPEPPNTNVTSRYFWVYWVVAIPLTSAVMIIWRKWWQMEEKKYQDELNAVRAARVFSAASRGYVPAPNFGALPTLAQRRK